MAQLTLEEAQKMELEALDFGGIMYIQTTQKGASKMAESVMDYSEYFKCADKLSRFLMQPHDVRVHAEAEMLTKSGKATMSCDISKKRQMEMA